MKIKKIELKIQARINPFKERLYEHVKSNFLKDTSVQLLLIPIFALVITAWVLSLYFFRSGDYLVPLRYSSFIGFFELGQWYQSYEITLFFTLCVVLNIFLGSVIYKKDKFLAYLIVASNFFISIAVLAVIINFGRTINL